MKKFTSSVWFPIVMAMVLAGVTAAAYATLKPNGFSIPNAEMVNIFKMIGWAIGPVAGLLTIILAGILNIIRRIVRLRKVAILDPIVVLLSLLPWLVLSWNITGEPRFTNIAMVIIDFAARPLLWGSLAASILTILCSLPLFFKKK